MKPIILPYNGITPTIHPTAFIAPGAVVIGDVHIGAHSSVWYQCTIRGDVQAIRIGDYTNIQDNSVIHVTREIGPTTIGNYVTIGHSAVLHACTLEDYSFVGMQALVMDFSTIQQGGMLAAGAMLSPKKTIPTHQLWAGRPARHFRAMNQQEIDWLEGSAHHYARLAAAHSSALAE